MYVALDSPIAREGLERIGELYAIEREIRGLSPDERRRERQQRAVPLLTSLHAWLLSQLAQLPQGSALAKAIRYAVKPAHWPALTYYCTDGQAEIDDRLGTGSGAIQFSAVLSTHVNAAKATRLRICR